MSLVRDLQFSLRQLRKSTVFTVVAVLTLALGIGCNTAIFSVFYSVLLRPLPFPDPSRVVMISERATQFPILSASWQNFKDWQAQSTSFEEFGATRVFTSALTGNGEPEQIPSQMISGNLLHLLGVNVVAGRSLTTSDDQPSSPAVALLGYGLWQRKYGGSQDIIGQAIDARQPELYGDRRTAERLRTAATIAGRSYRYGTLGQQASGRSLLASRHLSHRPLEVWSDAQPGARRDDHHRQAAA